MNRQEASCVRFLERYYAEFSLLAPRDWMEQRFQRMEIACGAADRLSDPDGLHAEKAGDLCYQEGMYQKALAYYQTFWAVFLRNHPEPNPLEALRIMDKIANSAYGMSDYPAAIYYERSALSVAEKDIGKPCPELRERAFEKGYRK